MNKGIKQFIPPIMVPWLSRLVNGPPAVSFTGRYSNWQQALDNSTGYGADEILKKVRSSALKVATGKAVYERDSVLFDSIEYSYAVMAALARLASINDKLGVLDFGGGLGSSYRQFSSFLPEYQSLTWSIIEQSNFVECGKAEFQTSNLRFYHSVEDCLQSEQPDVALLSGVLQYLEAPYRILEEIIARKIQYLIVDLTPLRRANDDLLTVQVVRPPIYRADYPCWIFSENRMISFLKSHYEILLQFESADMPGLVKFQAGYRGFFCRLRI